MTAENDADREAFEALRRRLSGLVLDLRCDEENDAADDVQKAIDALTHARQPGEPVAWMAKNEFDQWCTTTNKDLAKIWRKKWPPVQPLYAHPTPPAPVAVPEGLDEEFQRDLDATDFALIDAAWEHHRDAVPAARVINDNQPGNTAIIEVLCNPPTLVVGTELYRRPGKFAAPEAENGDADRLADKIEDLVAEFGSDAVSIIGEWIGEWRHNRRTSATPSPASPEKGTERMREALEKIAEPLDGICIGDPWAFYADLQEVARAALHPEGEEHGGA